MLFLVGKWKHTIYINFFKILFHKKSTFERFFFHTKSYLDKESLSLKSILVFCIFQIIAYSGGKNTSGGHFFLSDACGLIQVELHDVANMPTWNGKYWSLRLFVRLLCDGWKDHLDYAFLFPGGLLVHDLKSKIPPGLCKVWDISPIHTQNS